jgi:hypothetical protein
VQEANPFAFVWSAASHRRFLFFVLECGDSAAFFSDGQHKTKKKAVMTRRTPKGQKWNLGFISSVPGP